MGYNDIEVLNFDIDIPSISNYADIEGRQNRDYRYRRSEPSITSCHIIPDIEGHSPTFDIEVAPSIT